VLRRLGGVRCDRERLGLGLGGLGRCDPPRERVAGNGRDPGCNRCRAPDPAGADHVGWPVVLKTVDPRLARRMDMGALRAYLESEEALRAGYLSMAATLCTDEGK